MLNIENLTLEEIENKLNINGVLISKNYYLIPIKTYCKGFITKELHIITTNSGKVKKYIYRFDIS